MPNKFTRIIITLNKYPFIRKEKKRGKGTGKGGLLLNSNIRCIGTFTTMEGIGQ